MSQIIRKIVLLVIITLGWINMPAQAFLSPSEENLWPVMSQQFTFASDKDHSDVRQQLDWDLRNPKYIHRLTVNARPYLYYVFQQTKKLHLPAELALLPMIESDYMPSGSSDVGAAGLWQLMPGLATDYGVKMNYFYDGRRSTTVSTNVALHFLSYLYQMFDHNWLLALAAYNAGPGTVMEAIHYNKAHGLPTNFWALPLPKQTEHYIPKLLALAAIIQHPNAYGMHLSPVPNKAVTSNVTINNQMKLKTIASMAHTSVSTVKKLNPGLKHSSTPPHQSITVMLPASKKPMFVQHLKARKEIQKQIAAKNYQHYTVKHGDSLGKIATRYKTSTALLKKINQFSSEAIRVDETMLVPNTLIAKADHTKQHAAAAVNKKHLVAKTIPKKHTRTYSVRHGDDLNIIAARYHTSAKHLMVMNHLHRDTLQVGEKLKV